MEEGKVREILGNRISAQDTKVVAALSALVEERSKQRVVEELEALLRKCRRPKTGYGLVSYIELKQEMCNRLAELREAA